MCPVCWANYLRIAAMAAGSAVVMMKMLGLKKKENRNGTQDRV
jgi:hypothetical protein